MTEKKRTAGQEDKTAQDDEDVRVLDEAGLKVVVLANRL